MNFWGIPFRSATERRRRKRVMANRARHPDLIKGIWDYEDMVVSGILMRDRDRMPFRDEGMGDTDPRFPILADYLYMEPASEWGRRPLNGLVAFWRLLAGTSLVRSI